MYNQTKYKVHLYMMEREAAFDLPWHLHCVSTNLLPADLSNRRDLIKPLHSADKKKGPWVHFFYLAERGAALGLPWPTRHQHFHVHWDS